MQEFRTKAISTATTTSVTTAGKNMKIHTVVCPKALTGTATFQDTSASAYFVLPIGSIGTFILDSVFPNGLDVVTSAGDTVLVNYISY